MVVKYGSEVCLECANPMKETVKGIEGGLASLRAEFVDLRSLIQAFKELTRR